MNGYNQPTTGEPPEGVLAGEDVPRENEEEKIEYAKIVEVANALKATDKYYTYNRSERIEKAKELLQKVN